MSFSQVTFGNTTTIKQYAQTFNSNFSELEARFKNGEGSPEGVLTADYGCIYQNETNGDIYVKATNSSLNTGWKQYSKKEYVDSEIGSLILIPDNYITGLVVSPNSTDSDHDVDISTGVAKDSTNAEPIELSSALTKQLDNTFNEGTNQGGLATGSISADTTYHVFAIKKDDGTVDVCFDTDIDCSNIPTGFTKYRRIGSVITDSSSDILPFTANETDGGGVEVSYDTRITEVNNTDVPTSMTALTITVPPNTKAKISARCNETVNQQVYLSVAEVGQSTNPINIYGVNSYSGGSPNFPAGNTELFADSSSQILYGNDVNSNQHKMYLYTNGYTDSRRS